MGEHDRQGGAGRGGKACAARLAPAARTSPPRDEGRGQGELQPVGRRQPRGSRRPAPPTEGEGSFLARSRQWQGKFWACRKSCAALWSAMAGEKPAMNTRPRPRNAASAGRHQALVGAGGDGGKGRGLRRGRHLGSPAAPPAALRKVGMTAGLLARGSARPPPSRIAPVAAGRRSPLTVAGAAAGSGRPSPRSLFTPLGAPSSDLCRRTPCPAQRQRLSINRAQPRNAGPNAPAASGAGCRRGRARLRPSRSSRDGGHRSRTA